MGEAVDSICQPLMSLTVWFSTTVDSQSAHKIPDFQYSLSKYRKYDTVYQERHEYPLLMKCSNTFFRCIESMVWASLCIFLPLMNLTEIFSTKVDSQNAHEMPNFKYPLSTEKWMIFYNERRPLLMKCFKTFLRCMQQMGGASLCVLRPLMGLIELCSTKVDLINCTKYQMLGTPSQYQNGLFSMTIDIHCLWSVSKSSLDTRGRWEKLLLASVYQLLVPSSHFLPRLALKLHTKCHISDTLSVQKMYYGILNCKERYPLLLMKCFKTLFRCITQIDLLDTHVGLTKLCSTKVDSQITNKMQVFGILSLSA